MEIAKTWVLSSKVLLGPTLSEFQKVLTSTSFEEFLGPYSLESKYLCILKLELEDGSGEEINILSQILESNWCPGLLLIRWSKDRQDEYLTGSSSSPSKHGHEYMFLKECNGYCLYVYLSSSSKNAIEWWKFHGTYQSVLGKMIESLKEQKLGWLNLISDSWAQTS